MKKLLCTAWLLFISSGCELAPNIEHILEAPINAVTDSGLDTVEGEISPFIIVNSDTNIEIEDSDNNGSERVTLTGGVTNEVEGMDYSWYEGSVLIGKGKEISHDFSVGTHSVSFRITNVNTGERKEDTLLVIILPYVEVDVRPPTFSAPTQIFNSELVLSMATSTDYAEIRYSLTGRDIRNCRQGVQYEEPIVLTETTIVKAITCLQDGDYSEQTVAEYTYIAPPPPTVLEVSVGDDRELIDPNRSALLTATIVGEPTSIIWTVETGPGAVEFSAETSAQTLVTLPAVGAYEIKVTISDEVTTISDSLLIRLSSPANPATFALPSENQGSWRPGIDVGIDGGIAQYLAGGANDRAVTGSVINVVDTFGADPSGNTNVRDAVANALDAANPGDVIYFPEGTYLFASGNITSQYKDQITIRGAGIEETKFNVETADPIFFFESPGRNNRYYEKVVTGQKTKGTSVLTIDETIAYTVGRRAVIKYENEVNDADLISGANPVWTSDGEINARYTTVVIKAVTATTVTIDPPLLIDSSHLTTYLATHPDDAVGTDFWGFEDFSVRYLDNTNHPSQFAVINASSQTWFYNIDFMNYRNTSSGGSCLKLSNCYKCEIRKNRFTAVPGSNSNGAIETFAISSSLIIDNIFEGNFDYSHYDTGNSSQNYIAFNYTVDGALSYFQNAHPSINLIEGNIASHHMSDGNHGSSSNNNLFRNWFYGGYGISLNRFKRDYVIAGNVFGKDGVTSHQGISFGNPNNSNVTANGFAGPTGSSLLEGTRDIRQLGFRSNQYVIQPEDIFAGDFWQDWKITGTLVDRLASNEGTFAMSGGNWFVGASPSASQALLPSIRWDNNASLLAHGTVIAVSGLNVTIKFSDGSILPPVGTNVDASMGTAAYQERDLDVEASTLQVRNYSSSVIGGQVKNPTTSTLPSSFAYQQKPTWWNDDGFNGLWPTIDPNAPVFDVSIIPAGLRYLRDFYIFP